MRGLFVTATDTGVGKTEVACALLRIARADGMRVAPFKPAQSGVSAGEVNDAARLIEASGLKLEMDEVCLHSFEAPLAPAVAARLGGESISLERIANRARGLAERHDAILLEGAGGLLTPLTEVASYRELVRSLALPALIVARAGLGTINHTLLTCEALRRDGIAIAGIILNRVSDADDPSMPHNAVEIARRGKVAILADLPFVASPEARAKALDLLLRGKVQF